MEKLECFAYDVGFYFMYIFVVQMVVPMPISIHNNQNTIATIKVWYS
jgi:hypothetical protein